MKKDNMKFTRLPTGLGEHDDFLNRISKTLYYTKLPPNDRLSLPVTELAAEIFTDVKQVPSLDRLDVEEANQISQNVCVSPCSLVMALIYVERLKDCNPEYLQKVAPSELFLVSLMVASKFLHEGEEDEVYNQEWAASVQIDVEKLNKLERDFLKAIKWTVFVDHQDFWRKLQKLEEDLAYREAKKRGWFSYTELHTLLDGAKLSILTQTLVGIFSMCIATYTAGLLTLVGSITIASSLPKTLQSLSQQSISNDLSEFQYAVFTPKSSKIDVEDINLEEEIQNILLESELDKTEICNQSSVQENPILCNCTGTIADNGWASLIELVTPWLSCLNLESNCGNDWKNNFNQNSGYITKPNFILESDPFLSFQKINNIKRKDTLDSTFNYYKHDVKNDIIPSILSHWQ